MKNNTNTSNEFHSKLSKLVSDIKQPLKLIIHAGTPKSGTTSLQYFMSEHHDELKAKGILYPDHFYNIKPPKHQWLIESLKKNETDKLLLNFQEILSSVDENTHTIFLSTEGIYNHWWDLSQEAKAVLAEISKLFETSLWVFFRDPLSFAESYYKQNVKNPQIDGIDCYGKDLSFGEMLADKWFNQHLDYRGFVDECGIILGNKNIETFEYSNNVIQTVLQKLELSNLVLEEIPRANTGLCAASIEILRVINRYPINSNEKSKLLVHVKKINELISTHSTESLITLEDEKELLEMVSKTNENK